MTPRQIVHSLVLAGLVLLLAGVAPGSPNVRVVSAQQVAEVASHVESVYVRLPKEAPAGQSLQALVALHGMGGNGEDFARELIEAADRNHWLLVAPTIRYGNWRDPSQVAREDPALIRWLAGYLDGLPERAGVPVRRRVFLLGHSRGAQLAHRFALFMPEKAKAVAALSAGTYTLPVNALQSQAATFPFGVADLPRYLGHPFDRSRVDLVQFWVGVGADDDNPQDLPREWDPFIGDDRVERARAFQSAMQALGAQSTLVLFRGAKHGLTPEMRSAACAFLSQTAVAEAMPLVTSPSVHRPLAY